MPKTLEFGKTGRTRTGSRFRAAQDRQTEEQPEVPKTSIFAISAFALLLEWRGARGNHRKRPPESIGRFRPQRLSGRRRFCRWQSRCAHHPDPVLGARIRSLGLCRHRRLGLLFGPCRFSGMCRAYPAMQRRPESPQGTPPSAWTKFSYTFGINTALATGHLLASAPQRAVERDSDDHLLLGLVERQCRE